MRFATKAIIAASVAVGALAAAPASARTFISVGFGGPAYGYYPGYYPAYYPGYYAPPVYYGGWYGHPYWGGGYYRGWHGGYRGWHGGYHGGWHHR